MVFSRGDEETHLSIVISLADPSLRRPVAIFALRLLDLSRLESRLRGIDCLSAVCTRYMVFY
jgi:hypothetical protein